MRSLEYSEVDLVNGTSFHGVTIKTSINKLTEVLGEPVIQENGMLLRKIKLWEQFMIGRNIGDWMKMN